MKKKKHARWRWYEILLVGALLGLAVCSTAWLTSYWGQMRAAQHTPQQPEYYLRRDFEEQYSLAGTPFLDVRSSPADSRNLIIHGHNMKDGSMFAPLRFYLEKEYGLEHSSFELSFADGVRRYALMTVLHIELTPENVEQYYKQPQTQEAFEAFVEMLEQESLYCGGASAQWGEQLLTLSTCDNQRDNGRILVVARETK